MEISYQHYDFRHHLLLWTTYRCFSPPCAAPSFHKMNTDYEDRNKRPKCLENSYNTLRHFICSDCLALACVLRYSLYTHIMQYNIQCIYVYHGLVRYEWLCIYTCTWIRMYSCSAMEVYALAYQKYVEFKGKNGDVRMHHAKNPGNKKLRVILWRTLMPYAYQVTSVHPYMYAACCEILLCSMLQYRIWWLPLPRLEKAFIKCVWARTRLNIPVKWSPSTCSFLCVHWNQYTTFSWVDPARQLCIAFNIL